MPVKVLIITGIFPPDIGGPATYVPQVGVSVPERPIRIVLWDTRVPSGPLGSGC